MKINPEKTACKYCERTLAREIMLNLAVLCGASAYPPPDYCHQSPTEKHEYIRQELEATDGS